MIQIQIKKTENEVTDIVISGHAGYGVSGTDIVCAAVSSITITSVNAILRFDSNAIEYQEKEGFISIHVVKQDKTTKILLENFIELLKELEQDYKKYIKIKQ